MAGGGGIFDTFTAWVAVSTIPLWAIAIVLKRFNARRRAREAAAAKQAETGDCFFSVASEHAGHASQDLPLRFRKWDGQ